MEEMKSTEEMRLRKSFEYLSFARLFLAHAAPNEDIGKIIQSSLSHLRVVILYFLSQTIEIPFVSLKSISVPGLFSIAVDREGIKDDRKGTANPRWQELRSKVQAYAILRMVAEQYQANLRKGEKPDKISLRYEDIILRLRNTGEYNCMVLSGGIVSPKTVQTKPHAEIMQEWIMSQTGGPRGEQLLVENHSRDTYENAILSFGMITDWLAVQTYINHEEIAPCSTSLTVVTEKHHGRRFLITFKRGLGWDNVRVIPAEYSLTYAGSLLEWALWLMHLTDPAGKGPLAKLNQKMRTQQ